MEQMVWQTTQQNFTEKPPRRGTPDPLFHAGVFCFEVRRMTKKHDYREWPMFWFVKLDQAKAVGDIEGAERAIKELRRLGVFVRWGRGKAGEVSDED